MNCPKCTHEIQPGEAFCGVCGTYVETVVAPLVEEDDETVSSPSQGTVVFDVPDTLGDTMMFVPDEDGDMKVVSDEDAFATAVIPSAAQEDEKEGTASVSKTRSRKESAKKSKSNTALLILVIVLFIVLCGSVAIVMSVVWPVIAPSDNSPVIHGTDRTVATNNRLTVSGLTTTDLLTTATVTTTTATTTSESETTTAATTTAVTTTTAAPTTTVTTTVTTTAAPTTTVTTAAPTTAPTTEAPTEAPTTTNAVQTDVTEPSDVLTDMSAA